jgi:hypothetical protein
MLETTWNRKTKWNRPRSKTCGFEWMDVDGTWKLVEPPPEKCRPYTLNSEVSYTFAHLQVDTQEDAKKSIQDFANQYGNIFPQEVRGQTRTSKSALLAEWRRRVIEMRGLVDLVADLSQGALIARRTEVLRHFEQAMWREADKPALEHLEKKDRQILTLPASDPRLLKSLVRVALEPFVGRWKHTVAELLENAELSWLGNNPGKPHLVFNPDSLGQQMYFEVWDSLLTGRQRLICPRCRRVFTPKHPTQMFCRRYCSFRKFQLRRRDAIALQCEGMPATDIADKLYRSEVEGKGWTPAKIAAEKGKKTAQVKKWIQKAAANPTAPATLSPKLSATL